MYGVPPKCPRCGKGNLRYAQGEYHCPGFYSDVRKARVDCDYHVKCGFLI